MRRRRTETRRLGDRLTYHSPQFAGEDDWDALDGWDGLADDGEYLDLEHSELDRRLRNLSWPPAPPEVRERCLQAVLGQAGLRCPPPPPVRPLPPSSKRRAAASERVERYELSRRQLDVFAQRVLAAPRRQPRFAAVL